MNALEIARLVLTVGAELVSLSRRISDVTDLDAPELSAAIAEAEARSTAALAALKSRIGGA